MRWSLHGGFKYEQAKAKYDPFDRLVDEDPATRVALAELIARYAIAGQPVLVAVVLLTAQNLFTREGRFSGAGAMIVWPQ